MRRFSGAQLDSIWAGHTAEWRAPEQIAAQWREADRTDRKLLNYRVRGQWWETLHKTGATLLVTREYEHLVIALSATEEGHRISYYPLPHPSGLVVDRSRRSVYIASTRNPNQVYELKPVRGVIDRLDVDAASIASHPLVPVRSWFVPGCLYIHDLALIGGKLHANAVGQNAVVRLDDDGDYKHVWWPRAIERPEGPIFGRNHLQLNSIAAGATLRDSFFSASTDEVTSRRPGHRNFPVDGRGVIFSGKTRAPIARGLTRPHSARLHKGEVWVANSGYGELTIVRDGGLDAVARLPGWTRGLSVCGDIAFVGTSRVIPRFRQYAPGLDVGKSVCGVHAVELTTGRSLGSLTWPLGNQIFAIDWLPHYDSLGFPFRSGGRRSHQSTKNLFYAFRTKKQ